MLSARGHTQSHRYFPDHLHVEPGVVAELAIIAGFVVCLYGFRLLRVLIFLCGFLAAGLLFSATLENTFGLTNWVLAASWIGCIIAGIAGGCVALAFFPFGVFLAGTMLTYAFTSSLPYRLFPDAPNTALDVVVTLLGGILAWLLVQPFVIIATSLMGSIAVIWGIGYFAGRYPSDGDIEHFHLHEKDWRTWMYAVPVSWWAYLAAMLLLFVVGILKQARDASNARNRSHIGRYTGRRSNILP
uniref:Transmembrane protein 198 n=1 Tax=Hyaloperonospora arabidopsidis (strain Emoy2) TaxID=559515 RepID=M4B7A3_HYAAE